MIKAYSLKEIFSDIQKQGYSIRKRFALCIISALFSVIAALFLIFNLLGIINPTASELEQVFTQQLDYSAKNIEHDMDSLAAHAVEFSEALSDDIESFYVPFSELRNNVDALSALQSDTYDTVLGSMKLADCSGAFYLLNTTVNDRLDADYYSGIYLKYANIGSDIMFHNSVCMFRGASDVARQNNINLFSTWECETKAGTFPVMEAVMKQLEADPALGYVLTPTYKLPDAWEHVRLLAAPISDSDGNIIGVCGFEISDPFFDAAYPASDVNERFVVCALLDEDDGAYTGQIAPNRSGYSPTLKGEITVKRSGDYSVFSDDNTDLIGISQDIHVGSSAHTVAVMMPMQLYNQQILSSRIKLIAIFAAVTILSVIASVLLSNRYTRPILQSIEQIKANQLVDCDTNIPEIDDLFDYLAQQDRLNEAALAEAEQAKAAALTAIEEMQEKYDEISKQVERLAYSRKDEIDPYDYAHFKKGVNTLTPKEKELFNLYIHGYTVKEIVAMLQLQESTVRFHNKNIYSKLGVHSLKQLLRYAAVMTNEAADDDVDADAAAGRDATADKDASVPGKDVSGKGTSTKVPSADKDASGKATSAKDATVKGCYRR